MVSNKVREKVVGVDLLTKVRGRLDRIHFLYCSGMIKRGMQSRLAVRRFLYLKLEIHV